MSATHPDRSFDSGENHLKPALIAVAIFVAACRTDSQQRLHPAPGDAAAAAWSLSLRHGRAWCRP
jgi:hypothetical protein